MRSTLRRVSLGSALLLLLAFAWFGLSGAIRQLPQSATVGRQAQSVAQLMYGLTALLSAATVFRWRRWARVSRAGLVVSCTLAAALAPVVWGGAPPVTGLLVAAVGGLMASAILWLLQVGERVRPNAGT